MTRLGIDSPHLTRFADPPRRNFRWGGVATGEVGFVAGEVGFLAGEVGFPGGRRVGQGVDALDKGSTVRSGSAA